MIAWVGLGAATLIALGSTSLIAGVGITALGPGGVLVPIALFTLTPLSPGQVAGTAIVTHVGTGLLGSAVYVRSGQLREPLTARTAAILAATATVGAPVGVLLNSELGRSLFSQLLGLLVAVVGVLVWRRAGSDSASLGPAHRPGVRPLPVSVIGFGVAAVSGLFGLGGPLLSVPLLIIAGVPLLSALAAAQAQSVVIATAGAAGYLVRGTISWPLALVIAIPELLGVLIGWRIAHRAPAGLLMRTLAIVLVALGPYIASR